MTQFAVGSTYRCRSIGDHNCIWDFTVVRRTDKTVTFRSHDDGTVVRKKVSEYAGAETCQPLGRYSFSPVLTAEKLVTA
jgi:hypothetical protein